MCLTCYDGAWYPAVAGAQPADGGERQVCQQEGGRLHQEQVSHPSWLYIYIKLSSHNIPGFLCFCQFCAVGWSDLEEKN